MLDFSSVLRGMASRENAFREKLLDLSMPLWHSDYLIRHACVGMGSHSLHFLRSIHMSDCAADCSFPGDDDPFTMHASLSFTSQHQEGPFLYKSVLKLATILDPNREKMPKLS